MPLTYKTVISRTFNDHHLRDIDKGIQYCELCDDPLPKPDHRKLYCKPCKREIERTRQQVNKELARIKKGKPGNTTPLLTRCRKCGYPFVPYTNQSKFCADCRPQIVKQYHRRYKKKIRTESGTLQLGKQYPCHRCHINVTFTNPNQKYCRPCANELKRERYLEKYYRNKDNTPPTIRLCRRCETVLENAAPNRKYCQPCNKERERERSIRRSAAASKGVKGKQIKCQTCDTIITTKTYCHRFCEPCSKIRRKQRLRDWAHQDRKAKGVRQFGSIHPCPDCGNNMTIVNNRQIRCPDCAKKRKRERNKRGRIRRKENRHVNATHEPR